MVWGRVTKGCEDADNLDTSKMLVHFVKVYLSCTLNSVYIVISACTTLIKKYFQEHI